MPFILCEVSMVPWIGDGRCNLECSKNDCWRKSGAGKRPEEINTPSEPKLFRREMVDLNDPVEGPLMLKIAGESLL